MLLAILAVGVMVNATSLMTFAEDNEYDENKHYAIAVGGKWVEKDHPYGEGWTYEETDGKGTLTLTDAHITDTIEYEYNDSYIYAGDVDLTVVLNGKNVLGDANESKTGTVIGLYCMPDTKTNGVTIEGDGELEINADFFSVYSETFVNLKSGSIDCNNNGDVAVYALEGFTMDGGKLDMSDSKGGGIQSVNDVTINDGEIISYGIGYDCILSEQGNVIIKNGTLSLTSSKHSQGWNGYPIVAKKDIIIEGGNVSAINTIDEGNVLPALMSHDGDIIITGGKLDCESYSISATYCRNFEASNCIVNAIANHKYGRIGISCYKNLTIDDARVYAEAGITPIYAADRMNIKNSGKGHYSTFIDAHVSDTFEGETEDVKSPMMVFSDVFNVEDGLIFEDDSYIELKEETYGKYSYICNKKGELADAVVIRPSAYNVEMVPPVNGTFTVNNTKVMPGAEVVITATPNTGYAVDKMVYYDEFYEAGYSEENVISNSKFIMPKSKIKIMVTFKPVPTPAATPTPAPAAAPAATTISSAPLIAALRSGGKQVVALTWDEVKGVDGYEVYFGTGKASKGKKVCKKVATLTGSKKTTWKKIKLKKNKLYIAYVKAYVMKNGAKSYVKESPEVYAYTGNKSKAKKGQKAYTNPKKLNIKTSKITVAKGKTKKIKATITKQGKGKLLSLKKAKKFRYISGDSKIATVDKNGTVKGVGKGTCKIYVYTINGISSTVSVTVN